MGVVVGIAGVVTELALPGSPYNLRVVTGLGILFVGAGIGYLVRYRGALRDEQSARRITAEERDERMVSIRTRAGNRAYWTSAALVYVGLMWSSFAANRGLPPLDGDTLWYFLAAATVIPLGVYAGSVMVDERSH